LLRTATRLEGHPDNVAAALRGGLTVSCVAEDGHVIARSTPWPEGVHFVTATPDVALATSAARRVLPDSIPRADAVFNLQRALLLLHALQAGELDLLREALRDRWHQPYRARMVPGLDEALALRHPHLLGVCLSGSGPTVLAFCTGAIDDISAMLADVYRRRELTAQIRVLAAHSGT
jgi:homoserine kinase